MLKMARDVSSEQLVRALENAIVPRLKLRGQVREGAGAKRRAGAWRYCV